MYCFLVFVFVCIYVYVFDDCSALRSRVDFELPEEYLEQPPSSQQFEQQQEQFEEGKYNMNNTYHEQLERLYLIMYLNRE